MKKIIIVDDEQNHRLMLRLHLEDAKYECFEADDGIVAQDMIEELKPDMVLLDITMEFIDGLTLLGRLRSMGNEIPTIIITAHTDVKTAVNAMKLGATDFITKPVNIKELISVVDKLLKQPQSNENEYKKIDYIFDGVFSAEPMAEVIELLSMVAPTDATVLILGESGTGKELIARSIHQNSTRADKPFVPVNCAALNNNLIESELFGHVKGAFTGAVAARAGRFEQANGGTIFLDELGEIPLSTQTKLLRVLQEKIYEPVGSDKSFKTNARIIAATNKDLKKLSETGEFRQDLFFRLSVFPVTIPPLRQRREDVRLLINFFIKKYAAGFGKNITAATEGYIKKLELYEFPGNIRELENIVERSLILARGEKLTEETLPMLDMSNENISLNLKTNEKEAIKDALKRADGNKTNAAKILGISRRTLYYKLELYGLLDQY